MDDTSNTSPSSYFSEWNRTMHGVSIGSQNRRENRGASLVSHTDGRNGGWYSGTTPRRQPALLENHRDASRNDHFIPNETGPVQNYGHSTLTGQPVPGNGTYNGNNTEMRFPQPSGSTWEHDPQTQIDLGPNMEQAYQGLRDELGEIIHRQDASECILPEESDPARAMRADPDNPPWSVYSSSLVYSSHAGNNMANLTKSTGGRPDSSSRQSYGSVRRYPMTGSSNCEEPSLRIVGHTVSGPGLAVYNAQSGQSPGINPTVHKQGVMLSSRETTAEETWLGTAGCGTSRSLRAGEVSDGRGWGATRCIFMAN
ncbi:hypothetical protein EJ04DRAFT_519196 [Polyplosphaeria fusca]|uniref:Uncharacterized protein n=1 Tax=Polyplosphaeria fusca TaxID=682080 RepID=A0A9P4R6U9_9PLEO|nr:hypothetical protein EJ04DRAFT_519196 [Polyplosphaeria fusca]